MNGRTYNNPIVFGRPSYRLWRLSAALTVLAAVFALMMPIRSSAQATPADQPGGQSSSTATSARSSAAVAPHPSQAQAAKKTGLRTDTRKANQLYEQGLRAERAGDWQQAFDNFRQAAGSAPQNRNIKLHEEFARSEVVRGLAGDAEKEILAGEDDKARSTLAAALTIDPTYSIARERLAQIASPVAPAAPAESVSAGTNPSQRLASGPPKLQTAAGTRSFDYRGTTRGAYEEIARQFGVKASFDPDLTDRTIRFNVPALDFDTAMRALGEQTNTFWRSVDSNTFFVAADTPAKRRDFEQEVTQTILLPESETNDEMTETSRVVRDIVGLRRSDLDLQAHTLTVRDSLENVALAKALVNEMEKPHGEALLDIDILEVDRQLARNMGISPPTSTQIFPITSSQVRQLEQAQNISTLDHLIGSIFGGASAVNGTGGALTPPLIAFGGGSVIFLATMPGASAQLLQSASLVRSAQRVLMRIEDGRPATFFVGEHFPVTLALLSESLVAPGTNAVQIPSIGAESALAFPQTDYPVGNSPSGVAVGDFNGDGVPDLAVTNQSDNTVSILLGNGDGTFQTATTFSTGKAPVALVTGDFRGNGMIDLAVVNNCTANAGSVPCAATDYSVSILLGNGDGTFQTPVNYTVGTSPVALVSGSFHTATSGALDLAVVNQGSNTVSVLVGNGDGTFQTKQDFFVGTGPTAVATADFNNDGFADLAVTNGAENTFSVLLGHGNGTFTAQNKVATGNGPSGIAATALVTSGEFDLVVTNKTDGTVSVFPGNGNGTFGSAAVYTAGTNPNAVIAVDVNQDGMSDLIVADGGSNAVSIFLGEGQGLLAPAINLQVGNNPVALAADALTSDGLPDLTVVNQASDTVSVILNNSAFLSLNPSAPQTPYPGSQYVDLGLKVKATPRMHPDDEVTLDLQFDISSLSGQNVNGIPILSNRSLQQTVRLRDDQTSVLAGIFQSNESNSITGLPGLAQAGPLGYLASARSTQKSDTEMVIAITPRQLRLVPRQDRSLYAGRGEGVEAPAPAPAAPAPPVGNAPSGTVPQPGRPLPTNGQQPPSPQTPGVPQNAPGQPLPGAPLQTGRPPA